MERREKGGKNKGGAKKSDSKFVEKSPGNYKSRYKGDLSPKDEIVEGPVSPSFKSRYN